ncbi:MAG: thioredoxin domain-containing protein, partial [Thermoanaerobaculia bacterium]
MKADQPGSNRLAAETSPYLLLHKSNPVEWYPWGEEALARAKREDRPIFLSVGYSTCYWCHVMERESFSDPAIAEKMNRDFVCIKVDREERPDLDEIYMLATQILTHHGGWPNSVFLTPELRPFYAGTYFPPRDLPGRPGFVTVLDSLAEAWRSRRQDVEEQAESVAEAMQHHLVGHNGEPAGSSEPPPIDRVLRDLERHFDRRWGGFGGAPKFPAAANLLLLLEVAAADASAGRMLS